MFEIKIPFYETQKTPTITRAERKLICFRIASSLRVVEDL